MLEHVEFGCRFRRSRAREHRAVMADPLRELRNAPQTTQDAAAPGRLAPSSQSLQPRYPTVSHTPGKT
jgi:hypothetical protein